MSAKPNTTPVTMDSDLSKKDESQITVTTTPIPDPDMADVSGPKETEWKISIKNGDGSTSEVMLSPSNAKNPVRQEINIYMPTAKKPDDNEDVEKAKKDASPLSKQWPWYTIGQQFLTVLFSLVIIFVEVLTLVKYHSTQNVAGAWPKNPLLTPTYVLLAMAILSFTADVITFGMNCCYGNIKNTMMNAVQKIRAGIGFLQAIASAIGAGYFQTANTTSGGADLWGWSCSNAADAMQNVNASGTLCEINTAAWWLALLQTALHVLTVVMVLYTLFNPKGNFNDNSAEAAQLLGNNQGQESKVQMEFGPPASK